MTVTSDLTAVAQRLCGQTVLSLEQGRKGGNNRLYRVRTADATLALKIYPRQAEDPRDRLGTEFAALDFMTKVGFTDVPRPIAADASSNIALYQWVEGEAVGSPTSDDIDQAVDFARRLRLAAGETAAALLPPASEAGLVPLQVIEQVDSRLRRLAAIGNPLLDDILARLASHLRQAQAHLTQQLGDTAAIPLALPLRTLSPADFGFHNALRHANGRLTFLDFEYFGWDDPVKLTAEFVLHPGMSLSANLKRRFLDQACSLFASDQGFRQRLSLLYPIYALRWCAIVLNEFLPERWARRAFAGAGDRHIAEQAQLAKARTMLDTLTHEKALP